MLANFEIRTVLRCEWLKSFFPIAQMRQRTQLANPTEINTCGWMLADNWAPPFAKLPPRKKTPASQNNSRSAVASVVGLSFARLTIRLLPFKVRSVC